MSGSESGSEEDDGIVNSTDFGSVIKEGLRWWKNSMGEQHSEVFGVEFSGGRQKDGHERAPMLYGDESEDEQSAACRWHEARGGRLWDFANNMIEGGFAAVRLYNQDTAAPASDGVKCLKTYGPTCAGLMVNRIISVGEAGDANPRCEECQVPLVQEAWRCDTCGVFHSQLCNACFAGARRFAVGLELGFGSLICEAGIVVERHFALDQSSKTALSSPQADDGYGRIPDDKEFFHWRGASRGLTATDHLGQRTVLAALRTRLLRLGAEMSSQLFRVVLQLPVPFRRSRFDGYCYDRADEGNLSFGASTGVHSATLDKFAC